MLQTIQGCITHIEIVYTNILEVLNLPHFFVATSGIIIIKFIIIEFLKSFLKNPNKVSTEQRIISRIWIFMLINYIYMVVDDTSEGLVPRSSTGAPSGKVAAG